jgi:predicted dehydrogenase
MLLGEAESLWAFAAAHNLGLEVEDAAEIGLKMANGAIGSVHLDFNQQPPVHGWEIVGSGGSMRWDNATGVLEVYSSGSRAWESFSPPAGFERNSMFVEEMRHFLTVARGEAQPACTLNDGLQALKLALAARQSALENTLVRIA